MSISGKTLFHFCIDIKQNIYYKKKAYYTYLKRRFYRLKNKKCSISRANMSFFGGDAESRTPAQN